MGVIDFKVKGAIFDIDDTLLNNKSGLPGQGLHEKSRLAAVHEVGRLHQMPVLIKLSKQDNLDAFMNAPVHTLEAAVWGILLKTGIADSEVINPDLMIFKEIVQLKNKLHEDILFREGEEVPGAAAFVKGLANIGLENKLAIASTAIKRDINIFLGKTKLSSYFPDNRIISKESITHPKPNPEAFNLAFASLELPEKDRRFVCAFEDDPRGIMSAVAAGLFTCAITTRFSKHILLDQEFPPDLVAESFAEFADHFGLN